ncbi:zinc metalloprotease HtpX [Methanothermococcus okinawensis]|uniref:Protease HtpX homolog n=1 Tax=Methanothermococcus okinawensis (strain DSM 14208 / JCM 11175 / IH1) TaxID=647113 RepID=F8AMF5_METOI|nr:zinc metalloprotease HtpX [Methanothermococcus okinawensis]AEH06855.1 protease htpX [Methanothermococcus okinawensis IH1]
MLSTLKTVFLLALLTGLLYGACLVFHIHPLIAIIIALIPNLIAYFFSDKIVLMSYGAKIVDEREAPTLHRIVEKVAKRAGIPKPKVAIVDTPTPNAFATGRDPKHAVVAVTTGILNLLTPQELEGVIAHEISHVRHRDILISSIVAVIAGAIMYLANILQWGMIFGFGRDEEESPWEFIGSILFVILAPIAATIIQLAISRQREFYADEGGAKYSNPIYLANALAKLERGVSLYPLEHGNPATEHMFIVNPFRGESFMKLFSTHPPTEERIERLMEMAKNPKYLR